MIDLPWTGWSIIILCSLMVGLTKTSLPGLGILIVPLLALVIPAKDSLGFLLPMLCVADALAILYWRRHVVWDKLLRLLPWALLGILGGYLILRHISSESLAPALGLTILALIAFTIWRNSTAGRQKPIPTHWSFAAALGILAGVITMTTNAAGPVIIVYLLAMRLNKEDFLGTGACYFWIVNLLKIPLSAHLGFITPQSLLANLILVPAILLGGILGLLLVQRISNRLFNILVTVLAAAAALVLCLRAFFA